MPTLTRFGGELTVDYTNSEAMRKSLGGPVMSDQEYSNLLHKIKSELGQVPTHPNELPVQTQNSEFIIPQGGTLSDRELRVALEIGHIVCEPAPNPEYGARINGSSIDVTVGHYFYAAGKENGSGLFNPFSEADTARYFNIENPETDYLEAKPWDVVRRKLGKTAIIDHELLEGIPEDHPVILLRPNERILAHTHEFIGFRAPGTTSMQARSTTGRIGLSACYCAGWGDPGYVNRWTMEIHNLNENEYLPVPVGFRIAQLVFSMTGPVGTEYSRATGNYQNTIAADLETIKANWRPSALLPKAYKSEIVLPTPVEGLSNGLH